MIRVEGLCKSLGDVKILRGTTFTAPTGQITGLLGPNGAGSRQSTRSPYIQRSGSAMSSRRSPSGPRK